MNIRPSWISVNIYEFFTSPYEYSPVSLWMFVHLHMNIRLYLYEYSSIFTAISMHLHINTRPSSESHNSRGQPGLVLPLPPPLSTHAVRHAPNTEGRARPASSLWLQRSRAEAIAFKTHSASQYRDADGPWKLFHILLVPDLHFLEAFFLLLLFGSCVNSHFFNVIRLAGFFFF